MHKYFYIFKTQLMTNLQYITDVLSGFVGYAIFIFILFQLYSYLYSGSSNVINGYTLTQMVWYVVVTEVVWTSLGGRKLCYRISNVMCFFFFFFFLISLSSARRPNTYQDLSCWFVFFF